MAQKYLLSCECGETIPVEVSQSGEIVTCACGRSVTVPSMREVRQLPTAGPEAPDRSVKTRQWHPIQGALFGIGATMLVVAGGFAIIIQGYRVQLDREEPPELRQQLEEHVSEIRRAPVDVVYEHWIVNKSLPLKKERPFQHIVMQLLYDNFGWRVAIFFTAAAIGAIMVVAALVIRPRQKRPAPSR